MDPQTYQQKRGALQREMLEAIETELEARTHANDAMWGNPWLMAALALMGIVSTTV